MSFSNFKNSKNLLNAEQMKRVSGGGTGTCGFWNPDTGSSGCKMSKAEALFMRDGTGYWCCDSCDETSYCGKKK